MQALVQAPLLVVAVRIYYLHSSRDKKKLLEIHEVICISDISLLPGVIDHPNHLQLSFQQWAHFVVVVEGVYHHSLSVAPGASSIKKNTD